MHLLHGSIEHWNIVQMQHKGMFALTVFCGTQATDNDMRLKRWHMQIQSGQRAAILQTGWPQYRNPFRR